MHHMIKSVDTFDILVTSMPSRCLMEVYRQEIDKTREELRI